MLAVVELQGFLGVVRREGVDRVRQSGQCVFHEFLEKELTKTVDCRNYDGRTACTPTSTLPSIREATSRSPGRTPAMPVTGLPLSSSSSA